MRPIYGMAEACGDPAEEHPLRRPRGEPMITPDPEPAQVRYKLVYVGPRLSGKTTNLEVLHRDVPAGNRGNLTSISTRDGSCFDFVALDLGTLAGVCTRLHLFSLPGDCVRAGTRRLALEAVDGVVFVADSSAARLDANLEALERLDDTLRGLGRSLRGVPLVVQYNKRDVDDALPLARLEKHLNLRGAPFYEAVAHEGRGVFESLKHLSALVLDRRSGADRAAERLAAG